MNNTPKLHYSHRELQRKVLFHKNQQRIQYVLPCKQISENFYIADCRHRSEIIYEQLLVHKTAYPIPGRIFMRLAACFSMHVLMLEDWRVIAQTLEQEKSIDHNKTPPYTDMFKLMTAVAYAATLVIHNKEHLVSSVHNAQACIEVYHNALCFIGETPEQ